MSNLVTPWDDFIYFGEDTKGFERKKYLRFCLQCGEDDDVEGARYKLREVQTPAILLENSLDECCKRCLFPVFTSCNYKRITKKVALPRY
jgi:hypothetical protein